MKKKLKLLYVVGNHTYSGSFSIPLFREQLLNLIEWFPTYKSNASLLYDIIPKLEYILVKQVDGSNRNIIKYKFLNAPKEKSINFTADCNLIESFLLEYCIQLKEKAI
ncbi:MAG: hypothetical protein ACLS90_03800 [Clostridia bacterium]